MLPRPILAVDTPSTGQSRLNCLMSEIQSKETGQPTSHPVANFVGRDEGSNGNDFSRGLVAHDDRLSYRPTADSACQVIVSGPIADASLVSGTTVTWWTAHTCRDDLNQDAITLKNRRGLVRH